MAVNETHKTPLYDRHVAGDAAMTEFGGWDMPLHYREGIVAEHLATRKRAGLFDISHMGRFRIRGRDALAFLQYALTNDAATLHPGLSQYTMLANERGGAIDDAFLYQLAREDYRLVVNAGTREKDLAHLQQIAKKYSGLELRDETFELAMMALQGPRAHDLLAELGVSAEQIPVRRDTGRQAKLAGVETYLSRTGYTGEPVGFELVMSAKEAPALWDALVQAGAVPVGLGARDTLRLEDGLPLHGHELAEDMPIFANPLASKAVSFADGKGEFIGRKPLEAQARAREELKAGQDRGHAALGQRIRKLAILDGTVARRGARVLHDGKPVGTVTSGTMVPCWVTAGQGLGTRLTGETKMRPVALALVDSRLKIGDEVTVEVRERQAPARIVRKHLLGLMPPYAHPVLHGEEAAKPEAQDEMPVRVRSLLQKSIDNHQWRQQRCINLIPSEQSASPMVRRLSILDPAGRYAEHRVAKELGNVDVYYYQGTDFIREVEYLLEAELRKYLGCSQVETRVISGQMANASVFSAMVDYINRGTARNEQRRRLGPVMNNHIIKGGHLSAQPMGALHDFIARDERTGKSMVVNFPVRQDNPYRIDVDACLELFERTRPQLAIFGKSMVLHREPVRELRTKLDELGLDTVIMYDMAHVLGLAGPYFQEPFADGAHFVTGSTHKTYFGTQRGIVASNFAPGDPRAILNEDIRRRAFPGSVSNHHLGTLLGLLMAAYEMNHFRDAYQKAVVENAKTLARACSEVGLSVAGDPKMGYTETHQVILKVGYARGPEMAAKLEENNIICNYQATPEEDGFTVAGGLRLGVQEMTRFGMGKQDFEALAGLLADIILHDKAPAEEVVRFRSRFLQMQYCFSGPEYADLFARLGDLV